MIRGLRRGHRLVWLLLGLVLPALLALAVLLRPAPPHQRLPASLAPDAVASDIAVSGAAR